MNSLHLRYSLLLRCRGKDEFEPVPTKKTFQNNVYWMLCMRKRACTRGKFVQRFKQQNRNRKWKEKKQIKLQRDHDPAWWYWQFYLCLKQFLSNSLGFEAGLLLRDFSFELFLPIATHLFKQFGYENKTFLQTFLFWSNTVSQIERMNLFRQIEFQERLRTFQAF